MDTYIVYVIVIRGLWELLYFLFLVILTQFFFTAFLDFAIEDAASRFFLPMVGYAVIMLALCQPTNADIPGIGFFCIFYIWLIHRIIASIYYMK